MSKLRTSIIDNNNTDHGYDYVMECDAVNIKLGKSTSLVGFFDYYMEEINKLPKSILVPLIEKVFKLDYEDTMTFFFKIDGKHVAVKSDVSDLSHYLVNE